MASVFLVMYLIALNRLDDCRADYKVLSKLTEGWRESNETKSN